MQVKGAGGWRGQPLEKCLVLMQTYLGPGDSPSPAEEQGEAGQAPQGSLVSKYLSGLKCHSESPLWFRRFGIPSEIPILKCI